MEHEPNSPLKNLLRQFRPPRDENTALELPAGGWRLFFYVVRMYPADLILLNLLTFLLCLPVVTLPAALCSLSRVMMKLSLDGGCAVFSEYFAEFKLSLLRYWPFTLLSATFLFGLFFTGRLVLAVWALQGAARIAVILICAAVALWVYLVWCYALPLFSLIDLPVLVNIQNALCLMATHPGADVWLLLVPLGTLAVFLAFLPWSVPALPLVLFSLLSLMVCCIVKPIIQKEAISKEQ